MPNEYVIDITATTFVIHNEKNKKFLMVYTDCKAGEVQRGTEGRLMGNMLTE